MLMWACPLVSVPGVRPWRLWNAAGADAGAGASASSDSHGVGGGAARSLEGEGRGVVGFYSF